MALTANCPFTRREVHYVTSSGTSLDRSLRDHFTTAASGPVTVALAGYGLDLSEPKSLSALTIGFIDNLPGATPATLTSLDDRKWFSDVFVVLDVLNSKLGQPLSKLFANPQATVLTFNAAELLPALARDLGVARGRALLLDGPSAQATEVPALLRPGRIVKNAGRPNAGHVFALEAAYNIAVDETLESKGKFDRVLGVGKAQEWVAGGAWVAAATVAAAGKTDVKTLAKRTTSILTSASAPAPVTTPTVACPYSGTQFTRVGKGWGGEERFVQWAEKAQKELNGGKTVNLVIDVEGRGSDCPMVQVAQAFPGTDLATSAPCTSQLLVPGSTFLIDMPASPAVKTAFGALLGHPRVVVVTCDCRGDYLLLDHFGGDLTASQPFDVQCAFPDQRSLSHLLESHPQAGLMEAWKHWGHSAYARAHRHHDPRTAWPTLARNNDIIRYAAGDVFMTASAVPLVLGGRGGRGVIDKSRARVKQELSGKLRSTTGGKPSASAKPAKPAKPTPAASAKPSFIERIVSFFKRLFGKH